MFENAQKLLTSKAAKERFTQDYNDLSLTQKKVADKAGLVGVELYYVIGALGLKPRPAIHRGRGKTTMSKVGAAFQMPSIIRLALKVKKGEVYDWVILNADEKKLELKLMQEKTP